MWVAGGAHDRCRDASYSSTLAATAAFRLSTGPGQGMVIGAVGLRGQIVRDAVALVADDERNADRPGLPDRPGCGAARARGARSSRRPRAAAQSTPLRSLQAAARERRCPPMRALLWDSTRSRFPAGSRRRLRQMPRRSAESCPDCRDPECRPEPRPARCSAVLAEKMRPGPIRRLNQRRNRLRRFGRQRRSSSFFGNCRISRLRRQLELIQQPFRSLRNKDVFTRKPARRASCKEVRSLNAHKAAGAAPRKARLLSALRSSFKRAFCFTLDGTEQASAPAACQSAQFLLCCSLHSSDRHRRTSPRRTCYADSMAIYWLIAAAEAGSRSSTCTTAGAVLVSDL